MGINIKIPALTAGSDNKIGIRFRDGRNITFTKQELEILKVLIEKTKNDYPALKV